MEKSEELDKIAAARREARIQRILGNSKNRLNKIAGKEEAETTNDVSPVNEIKQPERVIYPDPEIERDVYEFEAPFVPMATAEPELDLFHILNNLKQTQPNGFGGGGQGQGQQQSHSNQTPYTSKLTKFLRSKIHFAFLAMMTYVMVVTDTLVTRNTFLMFLLWEAAEVFLLKTYEVNKTSFVGILLMLGGIPSIHSTAIVKFLETALKILNDLAVFVFYFVVSHILWKTVILGSSFENITNFEMI